MREPARAVFLSYASQDAEAARRICEALRAIDIEVWFDQSELRGGDAWDREIRKQIHDCALFIPIISATTQGRLEGYFRREWRLAVDRTHDMADAKPFLVPVVIDATNDKDAEVPDSFQAVQWTRLPAGETSPAFVEHISRLLTFGRTPSAPTRPPVGAAPVPLWSILGALSRRKRPAMLLIATMAVIGVGYFTVDKFVLSKRPEPGPRTTVSMNQAGAPTQNAIPEKSIAVLPFVDMSEKHDQEYFADGMAEEILDVLVKIPGLHVIGRTSSFQFKGKNEDLRKIGTSLGAAHLVEGSVRRSGDHVRVTAQLVRVASGAHEWSESYEREVGDVLKMQQDIAMSIARALQVTVEASSFSASNAINPDAYDFYLRGLNAFGRNDKAGLEEAINDFHNALQLEPSLARADEALALTQFDLADDVYEPQLTGFARVRESAEHLLAQNPRSFYGHVIMSRIDADFDWNWVAARHEADEAIAINPRSDGGLRAAAVVEGYLGQWEAGERHHRAALSLDPLNPDNHYDFGILLLGAGRYPESVAEFRRAYEISPSYAWSHAMAGIASLAMNQRVIALQETQLESMGEAKLYALAVIYHALGREPDSDAALAQLKRDSDRMAAQIAWVYAYRGEKEHAFEWLERAYRQKDSGLPYVKTVQEALLKNIAGDPRYKTFLRKMNLPE